MATDDPEGQEVFASLCKCASDRVRILSVPDSALVNAQASLKEANMTKQSAHVRWLETWAAAMPLVGGKNASLGEMVQALEREGVSIPPGFAPRPRSYWHYSRPTI